MLKQTVFILAGLILVAGCASVGSPYASSTKIYVAQNNLEEALENANTWISEDSLSPKPYIWRGFIYTRRGEYIEASDDFIKAFTLDSSYRSKDKFEKELSISGQVLMSYPTVATVMQNAAIQLIQDEEYDRAIDYLSEALRVDSTNEQIYLLLHSVYNAKGDEKESIKYLEKAVELNPKNPRARLQLAVLYSFEGKKDTAEKILRNILKDTNMVEAYKELGILLFEKKNYNEAVENFEKAYELKGDDYEILANLGQAYAELKNYQKATEYLKKAYELKNDDYRIPFALAGVLYDSKKYKEALEYINLAIKLEPENPDLYELRGAIYKAMGERKKALEDFKKAEMLRGK